MGDPDRGGGTQSIPSTGRLAIVAGGGRLPVELAENLAQSGTQPLIIAIQGEASDELTRYEHIWLRWSQMGSIRRLITEKAVKKIVLAGSVTRRPKLSELTPNLDTLKVMPQILASFMGGDDTLLRRIAALLESWGVQIVGAHELMPDLVCPEGPLGSHNPSRAHMADMELGKKVLNALSSYDVGQGAVVVNARVLAVEGAEGTDSMLARVQVIREQGRARWREGEGVLVKASKLGQSQAMDLPAIGPATLQGCARAGLGGIACQAGRVLMIERGGAFFTQESTAKLFVYGFSSSQPENDGA